MTSTSWVWGPRDLIPGFHLPSRADDAGDHRGAQEGRVTPWCWGTMQSRLPSSMPPWNLQAFSRVLLLNFGLTFCFVPGITLGLAVCKASALPTMLQLQPQSFHSNPALWNQLLKKMGETLLGLGDMSFPLEEELGALILRHHLDTVYMLLCVAEMRLTAKQGKGVGSGPRGSSHSGIPKLQLRRGLQKP